MSDTTERVPPPSVPPMSPAALSGATGATGAAGADNGRRVDGGGAHDTFQRSLLAALLRFKEGDFGSRMPADLLQIIRTQPPGSIVKREVIRNNRMREVTARLGERPDAPPEATGAPK